MPKEIVHIAVARALAATLAGSATGAALARHPACLFLGAVVHDALFYLTGARWAKAAGLADAWHGVHGEDPYAVLRGQAALARADPGRTERTAFLAGLVSHVMADAAIHPLVYALTGHYYDPDPGRRTLAVRRHRALETLCDMVADETRPEAAGFSLRAVLAALPVPLESLLAAPALAEAGGLDPAELLSAFAAGLKRFSLMQSLYGVKPLAWALWTLGPVLPAKAREITALFYAPQLGKYRGEVSGEIAFRHPVTGEARRVTLDGLMAAVVEASAAVCRALEPYLLGQDEDCPALAGPGPSLDTGLPGVGVAALRHFSDTGLWERLGL